LLGAATARAGRLVSVGYTAPAALRGLHVVARIPSLRVAEVRLVPGLRSRPGIRFVHRTVARTGAAAPGMPLAAQVVPEWQWAATHEDQVPDWVKQAAANVTIAVVDTGADVSVPALAAKNPVTWSVTGDSTAVSDVVGHGTFVASLAAGSTADANAMTGFGGDARLMVVQANRGTTGFDDVDEAAAITWAVDHGANIVNLSLGGPQTSFVERTAIAYATAHGVLVVASAGNSGFFGSPTTYPAALLGENGIAVGAATAAGTRAGFSTTGTFVDVLAPGVDVVGALAGGISPTFFSPVATPGADGSYGLGSGTSYSAPEVAGAAALVWAANPSLDAAGVARTIEATASAHGSWTRELAFGNLDVAAAVQQALTAPAPPLTKPVVLPKPKAASTKRRATAKPAPVPDRPH
jgi:subtilisin family serine protease